MHAFVGGGLKMSVEQLQKFELTVRKKDLKANRGSNSI